MVNHTISMEELTPTQYIILKSIANGNQSASEISKDTGISLPYITTQTTLLEAKDLITKDDRSQQTRPGKPKKRFRLNSSYIGLTILRNGFGTRQQITHHTPALEKYFQILAQLDGPKQEAFSTYYWGHRDRFDKVTSICHLQTSAQKIELLALTDKQHLDSLRKDISNEKVTDSNHTTTTIVCWVHTEEELKEGYRAGDEYYKQLIETSSALYDENRRFERITEEIRE
ncbi:MAG: winged helix-turn-helix domain-containing protein [Nanoarchaeota archaeon]